MPEKSRRGFAGMDQEKQREIASKGGRAAHRKGTAHEFTPEEAREAGRKGGHAAHQSARARQAAAQEATTPRQENPGAGESHATTEEPPIHSMANLGEMEHGPINTPI
ncbi:MAG: KGG domain-containing protein [Gemmataceae bacterium]|nr:KGG domain-containing protein [Gemmataceae bacterium]